MLEKYSSEIEAIISHRYDNGGDLWATPDKRLCKGSVFSTIASAYMLAEVGMAGSPIMKETADLIFSVWKSDGRFQIAPSGAIYPCHTAGVARTLCMMGYAEDERLKRTFEHLLSIQYHDGGWRCNSFKFGRGPDTEYSNPGTTLEVLNVFRFTDYLNNDERLDKAVAFLLNHWEIRRPLGPCQYGMGTLFMKVEFPFFRYNLFYYVYVLSFYEKARRDARFREAYNLLTSKMVDGKMIVENPNAKLAGYSFCRKGEASELATERYEEIGGREGIGH